MNFKQTSVHLRKQHEQRRLLRQEKPDPGPAVGARTLYSAAVFQRAREATLAECTEDKRSLRKGQNYAIRLIVNE